MHSDDCKESRSTVRPRSAHNLMVAERDTGDAPENGIFEAALRWVTPSDGSSGASPEGRGKEPVIMESLSDATVVITGASSGIGLATARAFARHGANVVLAARRHELLEWAALDCEALGGGALAVPTDVT